MAQALPTSRVREGINEDEGDEERTGICIKHNETIINIFISGALIQACNTALNQTADQHYFR